MPLQVAAHGDIIDTSGCLSSCGALWREARAYQEDLHGAPPPTCPFAALPPPSRRSCVLPPNLADALASPACPAVKRLLAENQLPHLLFYGPPGTGKTSTILAIARQIYGSSVGNMTLELNASGGRWGCCCVMHAVRAGDGMQAGSHGMADGGLPCCQPASWSRHRSPSPPALACADDRGIAVVRNEIQDFASTRTIFSNKVGGVGWGGWGGWVDSPVRFMRLLTVASGRRSLVPGRRAMQIQCLLGGRAHD